MALTKQQRASKGGQAAALSPTRKYPLRKVIGSDEYHEELECGHVVNVAHDMIGARHPARRRCKRCYEAVKQNT